MGLERASLEAAELRLLNIDVLAPVRLGLEESSVKWLSIGKENSITGKDGRPSWKGLAGEGDRSRRRRFEEGMSSKESMCLFRASVAGEGWEDHDALRSSMALLSCEKLSSRSDIVWFSPRAMKLL